MKKTSISLLFALSLIFILNGCKKDTGIQGPQGSSGPALSGNLRGYINLYDAYGGQILTPSVLKGNKVSADNTTKSAVTDSTGAYPLQLTTGTYNLTCMDSTFGTAKIEGLQFVGGGDSYRNITMSKIPTFNATAITAVAAGVNVTISGSIIADNAHPQTLIVFAGNTPSVSAATKTYLTSNNKTVAINGVAFNIVIPATDFYDAGIASGQTAYFACYGIASVTSSSSYVDYTTGRTQYNAVSPTAVTTSVVVP